MKITRQKHDQILYLDEQYKVSFSLTLFFMYEEVPNLLKKPYNFKFDIFKSFPSPQTTVIEFSLWFLSIISPAEVFSFSFSKIFNSYGFGAKNLFPCSK